MNLRYSLFSLFLLIHTIVLSQFQWESKPSIPEQGRRNAVTAVIDDTLYVGLGTGYDLLFNLNDLWGYDITSETWSKKANFPGGGRVGMTFFTIDNKIYVGMGTLDSAFQSYKKKDMYVYDPSLNTWSRIANFPGVARSNAVSFVIDGKAYVGNGDCNTNCFKDDFYMYNPTNNTWSAKASFPGGECMKGSSFTIDSFGYVGNYITSSRVISNRYFKYDPYSNSWAEVDSMPGPSRLVARSFNLNGKTYVGCGKPVRFTHPGFNDFYSYDAQLDSWSYHSSVGNFGPRTEPCMFSVGDTAVYIGMGESNDRRLTDFWKLNLETDTCYDKDSFLVSDTVQVFDTLTYYDTLVHYDTLTITDTIYVNDTISLYDTIVVYDTTYNVVYDTSYVSVDDTLIMMVGTSNIANHCNSANYKMYPNPASSELTFECSDLSCLQLQTITITDNLGNVIDQKSVTSLFVTFDISSYSSGLYFVKFQTATGNFYSTKKLVITN